MAVFLSPVGGVAAQFFDNSGNVLTGGKLYTYSAGTTTPVAAYTSSLGNVAWSNPIVLDAAGRVSGSGEIWLTDGVIYKFVVKDSNDVLIATYDNITGINSNFVNFTTEQEIQTATADQTVFTLADIEYQPGTNNLTVYVDGVNQYGPGAQYSYEETDSTTVTFNDGLHVGASVKFTTATQTTGNATNASVVSYTPAGTGAVGTNVQTKLRETVSVQDFGAVGDGVTDDAAAIQAAFDSGARIVTFGQGGSFYVSSELSVASNSALEIIQGPCILLVDHAGSSYATAQNAINAAKKIHLINVSMEALNTDYTESNTDAAGTVYVNNTRDFLVGFQGTEGTTLENCSFKHFYSAVRIDGTFDVLEKTVVTQCVTIQCGGGSSGVHPTMNFYGCSDLFIDKHYAYIGDEITLPSNKKVVFTNSTLILPNKPSIDFGGSNSSGYEADLIVISNNIVYGRDPIVCEFGGYKLNISDNICVVTMVQPNGTGIGVTSGASGSQAIDDLTITGNQIRLVGNPYSGGTLATPIACGIRIYQGAVTSGFPSTMSRVKVSENSINTACFFGINIDAEYGLSLYGEDVMVNDNYIQEATYGIYFKRVNSLFVSDNNIRFATTAIELATCQDFVLKGNRTFATSSGTHYVIDNPLGTNNQVFIEHSNAASDSEAIDVTNATAANALPYMETNVMGEYLTTRIKTGSVARNTSPTSGTYIGRVCTVGGVSNTVWKNYGLIS